MSIRRAKTSAKMFLSDTESLKKIVVQTLNRVEDIVGSTLGPGGKNCLIESDIPGIPNKNTKDGVTVFKSLGAYNPYEHVIIEQARDAAQKTASEAGDGTTTATILAANLVSNIFNYCERNKKISPQKIARELDTFVRKELIPQLRKRAILIENDDKSKKLLFDVARVSTNGDSEMAGAVMKAFELLDFGHNSHITIKELSGPYGYEVSIIDGYPIGVGYEESIGHFHPVFINDKSNHRCLLENPLVLLYDGKLNDLVSIQNLTGELGNLYNSGESEYKNLIIFAHGFSENVLSSLAYNFADPHTINVVPVNTPKAMFVNSQLHFLQDLAAFTGTKIFGISNPLNKATISDLGKADQFEYYRFRSTIIANADAELIEKRVEELEQQKKAAASKAEAMWIEERLGKITSGISQIVIYGGSNGELKEAHDRCEDAVCAVRAAIQHGALPGGGRSLLDLFAFVTNLQDRPAYIKEILTKSLVAPVLRLFSNAGYSEEQTLDIMSQLIEKQNLVYDLENHKMLSVEENSIYDALPAVEQALLNAMSISKVMGTLGGIVVFPRDDQFERSEAAADLEFMRAANNPELYQNEANERI